ncbi:MAG: DUF2029 domain-containing protein [Ignavibacteriae bacterium]|nr:DUF2029 domain-containing protein [Ignavibacteriota bacterium]
MIMLKGYGLIPLLWLAWRKQWNVLFLTIGMCFTVLLITLPIFSFEVWGTYFRDVVAQFGNHPMHGHTAYQTISSFVLHLFSYEEMWLPHPLVVLPSYVIKLLSLTLVVLLFFLITRARTVNHSKYEMLLTASAIMAVNVLTVPFAEEHHFVLFLPLVIGTLVWIVRGKTTPVKFGFPEILFVLSMIIIALPLHYETMNTAHGVLMLFAYPKLAAGVIMLISFRVMMYHKNKTIIS